MVSDAAGDGGEVRVRGWEKVESYVGRENFLREGRGKDRREAGLKNS